MHLPDPTIPDAAYSALFAYEEDRTRVTPEETIRAVAAPLIAAELRAWADDADESAAFCRRHVDETGAATHESFARRLRRQADELAPVETDAADGRPL